MKLTAKELARHKPEAKADYIVFDDDIAGFGLRFREGRRSRIFQYADWNWAGQDYTSGEDWRLPCPISGQGPRRGRGPSR
jgi:hypothetical protein